MRIKNHFYRLLNSLLNRTINVELIRGPLTYNQDGLATRHNADFATEHRFAEAYAAAVATRSWGEERVHWRAHVVGWAARNGLSLEGDFVECGVNKGAMAAFIQSYAGLAAANRRLWLLDTFHGLVDSYLSETEKARGSEHWHYEECFDEVQKTFANQANVTLVRGEIPGTLSKVTADKVSYLGIDLNCVAPEVAAAEYFWSRLVPGAMIVLDDYGWSGHLEQKHAFDRFARERGVEVLSLPTGQGIIVKPSHATVAIY